MPADKLSYEKQHLAEIGYDRWVGSHLHHGYFSTFSFWTSQSLVHNTFYSRYFFNFVPTRYAKFLLLYFTTKNISLFSEKIIINNFCRYSKFVKLCGINFHGLIVFVFLYSLVFREFCETFSKLSTLFKSISSRCWKSLQNVMKFVYLWQSIQELTK